MFSRVIWSSFAENQLDEIFEYYKANAGKNVATKLVRKIILESEKLKNSPFIGQKESRLANKKIVYRYLVYKSYKIIYSVSEKEDLIKIADIFDTRQYPSKIKRKK
ncbi:Plasmid stabilization system protein ParE [Zunongwangia mangrovi]|uniref:Plasmid stabilization system protein ParE n=1 Tax=Zunongwangia mangrovi TaxID=1334022 RepID=A0A1I1GRZ3_9FLAO|nr:type II toxin-antitoxin system RelE/ParE family toxin [Zunongwangia mangrovi]SFC14557.1 Plasmid stabilization system protein ParE [Zunongwangia mangrovi]